MSNCHTAHTDCQNLRKSIGLSRIDNILFVRKRQQQDFLTVVHAKRDVVDGGLGQSRQSEIMRFGYPSRFL